MNVMILDVETGGLEAGEDPMVEFGCALFDVENRGLLWAFSTLIPGTSNKAAHVNGISTELLGSMCVVAGDMGTGLLEPCRAPRGGLGGKTVGTAGDDARRPGHVEGNPM